MQYIKFVTTNPIDQNVAAVSPGTPVKTSAVASSNIVFSEIKVTINNFLFFILFLGCDSIIVFSFLVGSEI